MDRQPIETAPTDGEMVDLWVVALPRYNYYFRKSYKDEEDQRVTDCIFECGQWKHWVECGDPHHAPLGSYMVPTHWMPLPDPPEVGQ